MKKKINWKHPIWLEIYQENNGRCMITDEFIPYWYVTKSNYHHKEKKSERIDLWYYKSNIIFCTIKMHMDMESMTKEKYYNLIKQYPKLVLHFDINKLK